MHLPLSLDVAFVVGQHDVSMDHHLLPVCPASNVHKPEDARTGSML